MAKKKPDAKAVEAAKVAKLKKELKSMSFGGSKIKAASSKFEFPVPAKFVANDLSHIPSHCGRVDAPEAIVPDYSDEMIAREKAAQEEIAFKRTCVAPLFNKGPYQLITGPALARDIGKKTSQLED